MSWREQAPCWPANWAHIERIIGESINTYWWVSPTPDAGWKLLAKGEDICERFCDSHDECGSFAGPIEDKVGVWAGGIRGMVRPNQRRGK